MHVYCVAVYCTYKLCTPCEGHTGFHEPESLRICIVPSVARAIRGWLEGALKSSMSRVYGVHNMFSAYRGTDSVFAQAAPRVLYPWHKISKTFEALSLHSFTKWRSFGSD